MQPQLEPVWKQFVETFDAMRQILAETPVDRLYWRPAPEARSFGDIVYHVVRGNFVYGSMMVSGGEIPARQPPQLTRADLLAWLDRCQDRVREVFEQMSPEALRACRADSWGPLGPEVEGPLDSLWFAHQIVRHSAYHLGQLNYITLLLDPGK